MGRIFQVSTAKQGRRGAGEMIYSKQTEKASYRSFYNVQKTKLTARYPFLPSNQIERRIKQLWESASAEKRATFCSSLGGTTPAKSPFRGSILRGLLKSVRSPEQPMARPMANQQQQQGHCAAGNPGPLSTSSPRVDRHPCTARQGILRSSEKKRQSTPRVSFRLDPTSMLSPISADQYPKLAFNHQPAFESASNTRQRTNGGRDCKGALNFEASAVGMVSSAMSLGSDELRISGHHMNNDPLKNLLSTTDVNVADHSDMEENQERKSSLAAEVKTTQGKTEDMKVGNGLPCEPKEGKVAATPTRVSSRAAAIAAKTKMMSQVPGHSIKRNGQQEKILQSTRSKAHIFYRLRKMELSLEERQMYEFEDENTSSKVHSKSGKWQHTERTRMTTRPRLQKADADIVKNPEEYNLDSNINKVVFGSETESQSQQLDSPDADVQDLSKMKESRHSSTANRSLRNGMHATLTQPTRKCGRPRKSEIDTVVKKRGRPKKSVTIMSKKQMKLRDMPKKSAGSEEFQSKGVQSVAEKGRKKRASSSKDGGSLDSSQVDDETDGGETVPWMVSAHPASSSDEEAVEDIDESDEREDSLSLPSSAPGSQDLASSSQRVCESFEAFCRTNIKYIQATVPARVLPKSPLPGDVAFGDQDFVSSLESIEDAEIMSISTEYSMSSASELAFPGEEQSTNTINFVVPSAEDTKPAVSKKQKMRVQDGQLSDSSRLSQDESSDEKQMPGCRKELTSLMKGTIRKGHVKQPTGLNELLKGSGPEINILAGQEKRSAPRRRATLKTDFSSSSQDTDEGSGGRRKNLVAAQKDGKDRTPSKASGGPERASRNKRKCADLKNSSDAKPQILPTSNANAQVGSRVDVELYDRAGRDNTYSNQPPPKKPYRLVLAEKNMYAPLVHTRRSYVECGQGVKSGTKSKQAANVRNCKKSLENKPLVVTDEDELNGKRPKKEDPSAHGEKSSEDEENATPGDGLLCNLFQPNQASVQRNRRYIPAQEAEQVPKDPVACHLFREENFFD